MSSPVGGHNTLNTPSSCCWHQTCARVPEKRQTVTQTTQSHRLTSYGLSPGVRVRTDVASPASGKRFGGLVVIMISTHIDKAKTISPVNAYPKHIQHRFSGIQLWSVDSNDSTTGVRPPCHRLDTHSIGGD